MRIIGSLGLGSVLPFSTSFWHTLNGIYLVLHFRLLCNETSIDLQLILSRGTVVPLKQKLGEFKMHRVLKIWEQLQDKDSEEMKPLLILM